MFRKKTILVREYKSTRAFQKDANRLASDGWIIESTTDKKAKSGIGRKLFTIAAPVALFVPHSSHVVVTYRRADPADGGPVTK